jgi:hypothetical protein
MAVSGKIWVSGVVVCSAGVIGVGTTGGACMGIASSSSLLISAMRSEKTVHMCHSRYDDQLGREQDQTYYVIEIDDYMYQGNEEIRRRTSIDNIPTRDIVGES